jgi:hypothetical protein
LSVSAAEVLHCPDISNPKGGSPVPIAAADLFDRIGLKIKDSARWGDPVACTKPGVYAVSLGGNPHRNAGLLPEAPLSVGLVREWIEYVPTFTFDGKPRPSPSAVAAFIKQFWLPDESILYIGKATCLKKRLSELRGHRLGNHSPHKGGHWLKTLSNPDHLHIFFCECDSEGKAIALEGKALESFVSQVSARTLKRLYNPEMPIPFANGKDSRGRLKQSRIAKSVLGRPSRTT